ncbi:MAG: MBL fold metallo-hydrolase [Coriobacteriales bacterium]
MRGGESVRQRLLKLLAALALAAGLVFAGACGAPLQGGTSASQDTQAGTAIDAGDSFDASDAGDEASDLGLSSSSGAAAPSAAGLAPTALAASAQGDTLTATFLDVGQGDCCIIRCGGKTMIVDGGPPSASSRVYSWLKNHQVKRIDYLVATHADTDHVGGLSAALEACSCKRAYSSVRSASQDAFKDMKKRLARQGVTLKVPKVGSSWKLGSASVKVLAGGGAGNEGSLVLQVTHGKVKLLLAADATAETESALASRLGTVTLLKVAHHGSAGSTGYRFLRSCMPKSAVISVGRGNSYGHPTQAALSRLRDCGAKVYRTDMQGDITAVSTGSKLRVSVYRNAGADTFLELNNSGGGSGSSSAGGYIGNTNSLKFHKPSCKTLPLEHNRAYFKTRAAAVKAGYTPCGNCKP